MEPLITSRDRVAEIIDNVFKDYLQCWETLCKIRVGNASGKTIIEELLTFQPILATAIFKLEDLYRQLHQEKRGLISKKAILPDAVFKERMKLIKGNQSAIKETMSIGKAIGDAFAWIFYRHERKYLAKHWACKKNFHMPPGVGGRGELEFIKKMKLWQYHLPLYHGITTFLRLGDISLIDLRTFTLTALAELKTTQVSPNKVKVHMVMIGPKIPERFNISKQPEIKSKQFEALSLKMRDRLQRQLKRINRSFEDSARNEPNQKLQMSSYSYIEDLISLGEKLEKSNVAYQKAGDGLLLAAFVDYRDRLSERISGQMVAGCAEMLNGIPEYTIALLDKESDDNSICLDSVHYSALEYDLLYGMVPFFWWPLKLELIKKVIFRKVMIFSIYNTAHIIKKLRSEGYTVELINESHCFRVIKKLDDNRCFEVKGVRYFIMLIQRYLFTEDAVINIFNSTLAKAGSDITPGQDAVFHLDIQQYFK